MVSTQVEFYQGVKGALFRLTRTPEHTLAHLLFIAPLFEQANQTRHHITRSAISAYHQGFQSIVFDHYGTGDSAGELDDTNLAIWQQDIVKQLIELKNHSEKPIYLSLPLSAVLLLSDEIIKQVDGLMLLQPDFNGKRFVQQFKRLALAAQLTKKSKVKGSDMIEKQVKSVEVAGYLMQSSLLDELAEQSLNKLVDFTSNCYWFEWKNASEELNPGRIKQQELLANKNNKLVIQATDDVKFWQATELQIAQSFLAQEQLVFTQLLSSNKELN